MRLVGSKITEQIRAAEFIIECCATDRPLQHYLERRSHPVRMPEWFFPWLCEPRNAQMGYGETGQPGFRFRAKTGCTLVPDFSARSRRSARKRRDRSRMIMCLDLHQDMQRLVRVCELAVLGLGAEPLAVPARHDGGIVGIRR